MTGTEPMPTSPWRGALACLALPVAAFALSFAAAPAAAAPAPAKVTVRTVTVDEPGNAAAAIVPFTDAIYSSCADAPPSGNGVPACQEIGAVDYRFKIGELEITVGQWVDFLNTVDPKGTDKHGLYDPTESGKAWPKYGQINLSSKARNGSHYSLAFPEWADKPYGFADFLRAARFVNSLYNGKLLKKETASEGGYAITTYKVKLSPESGRGMYDLNRNRRTGQTREAKRGFVVPSQDEWVKSAYFDPAGGGTDSYWKYPTNAGVFGDGTATAPGTTILDPSTGDVTNAATQPIATYHASGQPAPTWCPPGVQPQSNCSSVNPFGFNPTTYAELYQGSLGTIGQAATRSPWGTLDQGGNAVEWTDTITAPPSGAREIGRVWRRLHGGVPNAPGYQLWLSAVGLQPQDNRAYNLTYPWLGFRVGVIGNIVPKD
jgi:hypothetical protein